MEVTGKERPALLASLLLSGAEAADEERGIHGEGPGGLLNILQCREQLLQQRMI